MTSKVENVYQKHTFTPKLTTDGNPYNHRMECTGLWDIKGSEGYIYPAFKNWPDEGILGDISLGSHCLMDRESDL